MQPPPGRAMQGSHPDFDGHCMTIPSPRTLGVSITALACLATLSGAVPAGASPAGVTAERGRPVAGCHVFPPDNYWNADISGLPVHRPGRRWLSHMSPRPPLHPDFGPSYGELPVPYGIPVTVGQRHATHA